MSFMNLVNISDQVRSDEDGDYVRNCPNQRVNNVRCKKGYHNHGDESILN